VRELQAIAQTGLAYTKDPYDMERYGAIRRIAAQIAAAHTHAAATAIEELFSGEVGHATPKVDVRGAVLRDGQILLVRERSDGRWTLPGGWVDVGEPPGVAVAREVREESGYPVQATKLAMLYDRDRHGHPPHPFHIYKLFFLCTLVDAEQRFDAAHGVEIDGVGWFAPDALPALSVGRVTVTQIARLFDHHHHPYWPTDFD
jgi:ADP-ribose pyrophosphatase YjhB (NUDIX family)